MAPSTSLAPLFILLPSSLTATWMFSLICDRSIKKALKGEYDPQRAQCFTGGTCGGCWAAADRATDTSLIPVPVTSAPWSCARKCLSSGKMDVSWEEDSFLLLKTSKKEECSSSLLSVSSCLTSPERGLDDPSLTWHLPHPTPLNQSNAVDS